MKNINDKKYSVLLFLFGLFSIIICNIIATKYYFFGGDYFLVTDNPQFKGTNFEVVKFVDFFALSIKYNSVLVLCVMLIALSIYTFLYKTDDELISILSNLYRKNSDIKLKLIYLKTRILSRKKNYPVTSIETIKIEKSEEQIKYGKIQTLKNNGLLYGFIILVIQIALYLIMKNYVFELSIQIIINFSILIILRFFSAYKCNELSEYNKGNSNLWFLFAIMFPSITLIIAGMGFSIKKEWEEYQNLIIDPSEQKTNKNFLPKYTIYLLIITLMLVAILYFKNSISSKKQVENFDPYLTNSTNTNPDNTDNNSAVAPDTTILNQLNSKDEEKEFDIYLKDSISRAKKEHMNEKKNIVTKDSLKKVKKSKPSFAEKLLNTK